MINCNSLVLWAASQNLLKASPSFALPGKEKSKISIFRLPLMVALLPCAQTAAQTVIGPSPPDQTTTVNVSSGTTTVVGSTNIIIGAAANATNVSGGLLTLDASSEFRPGLILVQSANGNALQATGAGTIQVLNGTSGQVTLRTTNGHAVLANGASVIITIRDGATLLSSGTGTGLAAIGGTINAANIIMGDPSLTSAKGGGAVAESGGKIHLSSSNSFITGGGFNSIVFGASGAGSQVDTTAPVSATTLGRGAMGIYLHDGGQVLLQPGAVLSMQGTSSVGVTVDNTNAALTEGLTINLNASGVTGQAGSSGLVVLNAGAATGIVSANNLTIQGANAAAGVIANAGSNVTLTGQGLINIVSEQNPTYYTLSGANLITPAGNVNGAFSVTGLSPRVGLYSNGANINSTGTTISVSSENGLGVLASAATTSTVNLVNNVITTTGSASYGLKAGSNGIINDQGSTVTSSGGGAAAFIESFTTAGRINLIGSTLQGTVANTYGLISTNRTPNAVNSFSISGGSLSSAQAYAIAGFGPLQVDVSNGASVGGPGLLAAGALGGAAQATVVQLNATGASRLTGDAVADATSVANISLADRSSWRGAANSITNTTVDASSSWTVTANSVLTQQLVNSGLVEFTAPAGGIFKTLTTGSYVGNGGTLGLNTFLGTDGSPSDRLVINGGTATGSTALSIANVGGPGAITTGNGIQVVGTINGGSTAAGTFSLRGPVVAGPYEYTLYRGSTDGSDANGYYLRTRTNMCGACPSPTPFIRPEVSLYAALAPTALQYGNTLLDSLDERIGRTEGPPLTTGLAASGDGEKRDRNVWSRLIGMRGQRDGDPMGITGNGPTYDYRFYGLQVGSDLWRQEDSDGHRDRAGLYGALGYAKTDVTHYDGSHAGSDRFTGYTLGGYWLRYGASDWYIDAIGQLTWYDISANSERSLPDLSTHGFGWATSLEVGQPLRPRGNWIVEPQAQLTYQKIKLNDAIDPGASVRFSDVDSLVGRLGVRVAKDAPGRETATGGGVRLSLLHEFRGNPRTEISSANGYLPFRSDLGGTWWEIKVGVTSKTRQSTYLYGNIGYQRTFDGNAYAWDAKIGMRMDW
jgi:outer membrane autotransporter protein